MTAAHRIILNMLATYGRTIFAMALGLFSARWVLESLGETDIGLMGVVGGLIIFVTFLNSVASISCARFFALSIGKGDPEETNRWFNTALSIHTILPSILILAGWPLGEWVIEYFFNIPPERLDTAHWVFRFSLVSAFWSMSTAPYMAMFIAKQRIAEMSFWGILSSIANFCFVYWLTTYKGDAWLVYAGFTVLLAIFFGVCQVLRARHLFPECRISFSKWYERRRLRQVFSFTGWQLFGNFGAILRGKGIAILLNQYFDPAQFAYVNASYDFGNKISNYAMTLSSALRGALSPEITSTEGRGDRKRMLMLANRASKFSVYLILLFAVPMFLEIDMLLVLWLKNPPQLTAAFAVYMIVCLLIEQLTFGHMIAVNAVGKIAGYQMMLGTAIMLTLPLAWLFLALDYPAATSIGTALIITTIFQSTGRVIWAKFLVGASPQEWLKKVLLPCAVVFAGAMLFGHAAILIATHLGIPSGLFRLAATSLSTFAATIAFGWLLLDKFERQFFLDNFRKLRKKLTLPL